MKQTYEKPVLEISDMIVSTAFTSSNTELEPELEWDE